MTEPTSILELQRQRNKDLHKTIERQAAELAAAYGDLRRARAMIDVHLAELRELRHKMQSLVADVLRSADDAPRRDDTSV